MGPLGGNTAEPDWDSQSASSWWRSWAAESVSAITALPLAPHSGLSSRCVSLNWQSSAHHPPSSNFANQFKLIFFCFFRVQQGNSMFRTFFGLLSFFLAFCTFIFGPVDQSKKHTFKLQSHF